MKEEFHLTLLGTRFPQLALAAFMARRGRRVLILESGDSPETLPGERIEGYLFRKRPAPLFGLETGGILGHFLAEMGVGQLLVREAYPANPVPYQVVLPRHRVNVHSGREALLAEIRREFPAATDSFRLLYHELDALSGEWRKDIPDFGALEALCRPGSHSLTRRLRLWNRARRIRTPEALGLAQGPAGDFLAIQGHFLGSVPFGESPQPLPLALLHGVAPRGTFQEPAGTAAMAALLLTRFREYGGTVEFGAKVAGLDPQGKSGLIVRLQGGERRMTQTLATTTEVAGGLPGVLREKKPRPEPLPRLVPLRFFLGIRESHVPVGMEDNLFLLRGDNGGPLGLKALYLSLSPRGSSMAPGGRRALTVTALVPPALLAPASLGRVNPQEAVLDLLTAVEEVIPFLQEGLEVVVTELSRGWGEMVPRALGRGFSVFSPGRVGRGRVRTLLRGRALVISPSPWELGMEGEALTAIAAAHSLRKVLGKE